MAGPSIAALTRVLNGLTADGFSERVRVRPPGSGVRHCIQLAAKRHGQGLIALRWGVTVQGLHQTLHGPDLVERPEHYALFGTPGHILGVRRSEANRDWFDLAEPDSAQKLTEALAHVVLPHLDALRNPRSVRLHLANDARARDHIYYCPSGEEQRSAAIDAVRALEVEAAGR